MAMIEGVDEMCYGASDAKADEDDVREVVQEHILDAYRIWRDGFIAIMPDDELDKMSELQVVNSFLNDVRELLLNKG